MRVFLDANILFSAARSDGAIRRLVAELQKNKHALVASALVVAEASRNVALKAPPDATPWLNGFLTQLDVAPAVAGSRDAHVESAVAWLVEKDRHVLAAAIEAKCDVLITGDRAHFGSGFGKAFAGVLVLSPAMCLERGLV